MTLTWNIVTKRVTPDPSLQKRFRQKIAKLEKHLQHFPPDAVHLQIVLEKHARKPEVTAALTLRVPSNILHGSKKAPSPMAAFDQSMRALIRELETLKSSFRKEHTWRKPIPAAKRPPREPARFTERPLPGGKGPQDLGEIVAGFLQLNHAHLLRHVSRQIAHCETTGRVRRGAVDPRAVVDEVARRVLSAPGKKPAKLSYPLWLYSVARQELARRLRQAAEQAEQLKPLGRRSRRSEESDEGQRVLEVVEESFESAGAESFDWLADNRSPGPDVVAAGHDLLTRLQQLAAHWPRTEREVFELYFVEGFDVGEIALIEKMSAAQVEAEIEKIQQRMRESFVEVARTVAPAISESLRQRGPR